MPLLSNQLEINRCPHCGVNKPSLIVRHKVETTAHNGRSEEHTSELQSHSFISYAVFCLKKKKQKKTKKQANLSPH